MTKGTTNATKPQVGRAAKASGTRTANTVVQAESSVRPSPRRVRSTTRQVQSSSAGERSPRRQPRAEAAARPVRKVAALKRVTRLQTTKLHGQIVRTRSTEP